MKVSKVRLNVQVAFDCLILIHKELFLATAAEAN